MQMSVDYTVARSACYIPFGMTLRATLLQVHHSAHNSGLHLGSHLLVRQMVAGVALCWFYDHNSSR